MNLKGILKTTPTKKPVIIVDDRLMTLVQYFVDRAPLECQWFHTVRKIVKDKYLLYVIEDFLIPEQFCSGGEVETDPKMIMQMWLEVQTERKLEAEQLGILMANTACWCHSHVKMAPTPSGQDDKQWAEQKDLATKGLQTTPQIMIILNKDGDYSSRIYDPELNIEFENAPIQILYNSPEMEKLNDIVVNKLHKKEPPPTPKVDHSSFHKEKYTPPGLPEALTKSQETDAVGRFREHYGFWGDDWEDNLPPPSKRLSASTESSKKKA